MKRIILLTISIISIAAGIVLITKISNSENIEPAEPPLVKLEGIIERREKEVIPDINIDYLRSLDLDSEKPVIEEELANGSNYKRYSASYISEGNKIYGLLTVPIESDERDVPEGGYSAIVFNHGYIPPSQYVTTEKYVAYVDYLARNGFVVFKIDLRGHGDSEGEPSGSYFSPGYSIDAINALKSLQKLDYVNENKIGMWGHSMAGNLVLRAMLIEDDIAAGVIWAGAVYSYEDFAKYRLSDSSYVPRRRDEDEREERPQTEAEKKVSEELSKIRDEDAEIDYNSDFWAGISLTKNINYLNSPIQLHHAVNDPVVNIGYSRDLSQVLQENGKDYEIFEYDGGGHNINSPYFEQAMQETVDFFKEKL